MKVAILFLEFWKLSTIVPIDIAIWPVFERNAIVRLFSDMGSHIHSCLSLLLSTIILNDICTNDQGLIESH